MRTYKTIPLHHRPLTTEDGSLTLFSEHFQENCHSSSGAVTETQLHYLQGCEILSKANLLPHLTILEVGFGLGLGHKLTRECIHDSPFTFLSLELDEELLKWFSHEHQDDEFLSRLVWKDHGELKWLEARSDRETLIILCGDARKTLPQFLSVYPIKWNAIYQDAFSPKKNPTLWTHEWFSLLKEHSSEDVILSTYSASSSIRKSLVEAGWKLSKGEKFGTKRSSTRARLTGETDPEILLNLERSPAKSLRDQDLDLI